ncbi:polymer-forming cytoskeletal protein [Archangium sp.]|uniref:polymer-forming cytoskeletal protein n=1 Tax=Archangium sp. TaxID=1872627 RepID=UPI002D5AF558|nr:polymer-forming cytoskeletal protein [Archangium sp.]HYO52813.1 polymer-forming cytoskeletal protein [Archangium sp.]
MKPSHTRSLLLSATLLASPLALAQTQDARTHAEDTINVQFRGSLRDALQEIAEEGGLNVVVIGALDTPAEVYLKDVNAEQALRTMARAYSLQLEEENGIFTVRPAASAPTAPAAPPPAVAPAPPVPPMPPSVAESAVDEDEVKERVREKMREARSSSNGSRDVVARGRSLEVKEGESVDSAVVYGGNLTVKGHVEDDVVVFGGNLEITGHVEGDAHAFGGNVVLGPGATVEGDVSSFGGTVIKQNGARVEGSTESFGGDRIGKLVSGELKEGLKKAKHKHADRDEDEERDDDNGFATFLIQFTVMFGLGFLGQMLFPARMKALTSDIQARPLANGVVGLVGALALIPALLPLIVVTVILVVTIIGIPVAAALWLVAPLAAALGFTAVASTIGMRLPVMVGRKTQAMVMALGLLLLLVLGRIPWVGWMVLVAATLVGFGAIIRTWFVRRPQGMPEPIVSEHAPV